MATPHQGRRITETRYVELREELAELRAELARLAARQDAGVLLAQTIGNACLETLKRAPTTPPPRPERTRRP